MWTISTNIVVVARIGVCYGQFVAAYSKHKPYQHNPSARSGRSRLRSTVDLWGKISYWQTFLFSACIGCLTSCTR